jgi:DNA polymerase-3 subunit beta
VKFICSQSDLNTAIALAAKAVSTRPTHPILGNILVVAKEGKIYLTGYDLSMGIKTSFSADITEDGEVTLPAKLFGDIVSRLSGNLTFSVAPPKEDSDSIHTTITDSTGRFQVSCLSADEYPSLPEVEGGQVMELAIASVLEGLKGTLFAASTDETKQVLAGVHLIGTQESLEFAATDGHRLAVVNIPTEQGEDEPETAIADFAVTIPGKALREVERLLTSVTEEKVSLLSGDTHVVFSVGDRSITTRKLEVGYPNYQQLIPRQFARTVTMERKRLLSGAERVSVLSDQKNNLVKFLLRNDNQLTLVVEAQDLGNAKENLPIDLVGEEIDIAFNVRYLVDGLKVLPSGDIQMQLNEGNQPVIFTPLGGLKMTYLVMPVQIVR